MFYTDALDEGYWKKPFHPTLCMAHGGQLFKRFHDHVHPLSLKTSEESFYQYAKLPAELQLRVLQQCDGPVLFQLMHTSHLLRTESKKLFFSDRTIRYRLHAEELLLYCSHPAESMYEAGFLASIEQLDLECDSILERSFTKDNEELIESSTEHFNGVIQDLWRTVQRLCPRAKRVRLSKDARYYDKEPVHKCYLRTAQLCPPAIELLFYAPETEDEAAGRRRKRVLWRLKTGEEPSDTTVMPKRIENSNALGVIVEPPPKPCSGHVGAFIKSWRLGKKFSAQDSAATMHEAAAIEKYYFEGRHESFSCSKTDCGARFEQPEQYTTHLIATRHRCDETAPECVKAFCAENAKRIEGIRAEQMQESENFWNWFGEWDTEQNRMAKEKLMDQLEHDPLYAQDKAVSEHGLLRLIYEIYCRRDG